MCVKSVRHTPLGNAINRTTTNQPRELLWNDPRNPNNIHEKGFVRIGTTEQFLRNRQETKKDPQRTRYSMNVQRMWRNVYFSLGKVKRVVESMICFWGDLYHFQKKTCVFHTKLHILTGWDCWDLVGSVRWVRSEICQNGFIFSNGGVNIFTCETYRSNRKGVQKHWKQQKGKRIFSSRNLENMLTSKFIGYLQNSESCQHVPIWG